MLSLARSSHRAPRSGDGALEKSEVALAEVALAPGRLVELCAGPGAAQTSTAVLLLRAAQALGDPVAWILASSRHARELFAPDLAAAGVDLDALVVVRVPAGDGAAMVRAAELTLRTGAFGAVALDFTAEDVPRGAAWQGRLLGLAREHSSCVLVLSPREASQGSLGPLVSLRFSSRRARGSSSPAQAGSSSRLAAEPVWIAAASGSPPEGARFVIETEAVKDKAGLVGAAKMARAVDRIGPDRVTFFEALPFEGREGVPSVPSIAR